MVTTKDERREDIYLLALIEIYRDDAANGWGEIVYISKDGTIAHGRAFFLCCIKDDCKNSAPT